MPNPRRRTIKIVVVGDEKVGKTSFIASLISEHNLQHHLDKVIGPVVLPGDMFNFDCTTVLIDTSSDKSDEASVENEIAKCDVVLVMYDMTRPETAERVGIHWMQLIRKHKVPVIIVGNKLDLEEKHRESEYEFQKIFRVVKPLIKLFNVMCENFHHV
jgi:Ras family protein T1